MTAKENAVRVALTTPLVTAHGNHDCSIDFTHRALVITRAALAGSVAQSETHDANGITGESHSGVR